MMKSREEAMSINSYCQMMEAYVEGISAGATLTGSFGPKWALSLLKEELICSVEDSLELSLGVVDLPATFRFRV